MELIEKLITTDIDLLLYYIGSAILFVIVLILLIKTIIDLIKEEIDLKEIEKKRQEANKRNFDRITERNKLRSLHNIIKSD